MYVRGRGDSIVEEKGVFFFFGKEGFLYIKVFEKFFVETDVVEAVVYVFSKVNYML